VSNFSLWRFYLAWMFACCWPSASLSAADGLTFSGIRLTTQSRVVPGGILVLVAGVANQGSEFAEGTILITIDEIPHLQSARNVALLPGQREQLDLLVQVPRPAAEHATLHLTAKMMIPYGDSQVILTRDGTPAISTLTIAVSSGRIMGIAMEPPAPALPTWFWPSPTASSDYDLVAAARVDASRNRMAATFETQPLPLNQVEWSDFDLFVISDATPLNDPAAVDALRQFMTAGGRVWIMLDRVSCHLIRPLLGPDQTCEVVERVEINDFSVVDHRVANQISDQDRMVHSELDIPMVRVLHSGGQVHHWVDGWPASIFMDVGYGQLALTTLGSDAWIEERLDNTSQDPTLQSGYQVRSWGSHLPFDMNAPRAELPLSQSSDYPLGLIGNPIVPKQWVAIALCGFGAVVAGMGLWLASVRRLVMIGVLVPSVAMMASVSLLLAATWVRRDIPNCVSRLQLIDVSVEGDYALIREQAAVHLDASSAMELHSDTDGIARTSESIDSGVGRYVISDFQRWQMDNADWPPGVWRYESKYAVATSDLVVAGRLTRNGLELQIPSGLPSVVQDPVLEFVTGNPMLCRSSAMAVEVDNHLSIDNGRWIAGTLVSDEQQRRLEIYDEFFQPDERLQRPGRRLYGWTTLWDSANWSRDLNQLGSALIALPVTLARPATGAEIFIPHGLVQLQRKAGEIGKTSAFNNRTGKWRSEVSTATRAELEFLLPSEVIPFAATAIELELDINAPRRSVTISVPTRAGTIELASLQSPSLAWTKTITNPDVLHAARDGRLEVVVDVSRPAGTSALSTAANAVTWHIDYFHANLHGSSLARTDLSQSP
jgi:hypothetical protein